MKSLQISWNNIRFYLSDSIISILLLAISVGILSLLFNIEKQISEKLERNKAGIDLVIGAKGSPLQIILSNLYHADNATGNISLKEAKMITNHPMVEESIPLAYGDSYKGFRILGTEESFIDLYGATYAQGHHWHDDFQAVIGASVANKLNLKIGDHFHGVHGEVAGGHAHEGFSYHVHGILKPTDAVIDDLILTTINSVWLVHEEEAGHDHEGHDHSEHEEEDHHDEEHEEPIMSEHDTNDHDHDHDSHEHEEGNHHDEPVINEHDEQEEHEHHEELEEHPEISTTDEHDHNHHDHENHHSDLNAESSDRELTGLLIKVKGPVALVDLPKLIDEHTNMKAARPGLQLPLLLEKIAVGKKALLVVAIIMAFTSALSVFLTLYKGFQRRMKDLILMRVIGKSSLFVKTTLLGEGIVLATIGYCFGLVISRLSLVMINLNLDQSASQFSLTTINSIDLWLFPACLALGLLAAIVPALKSGSINISTGLNETH